MGTRKRSKLPQNCVQVTPLAYSMIHALSNDSRYPVSDLLTSAIHLFVTTTKHLRSMNPPKLTEKPLPKEKRNVVPPIGGTVKHVVSQLTKGKRT